MRPAAVGLLLLAGCPRDLPAEQPCREVAWAVAARFEECTGDVDLAVQLHDTLNDDATCTVDTFELAPEVAYECAFVLRNLACELAVDNGDDLDAWFRASPVCPQILELP